MNSCGDTVLNVRHRPASAGKSFGGAEPSFGRGGLSGTSVTTPRDGLTPPTRDVKRDAGLCRLDPRNQAVA